MLCGSGSDQQVRVAGASTSESESLPVSASRASAVQCSVSGIGRHTSAAAGRRVDTKEGRRNTECNGEYVHILLGGPDTCTNLVYVYVSIQGVTGDMVATLSCEI